MAHLVYLVAFVLLSLVPQVAAIPGADLPADGDEERMMAEMNLEDLRDPNQPEQEDPALSNPFVPSILYRILHSEAALRRQQQELPQENAEDDESDDLNDEVHDVSNDNNDEDGVNVAKRVFCNGFTGCGGRHRQVSRRRRILGKRLLPVLVKRRFCTSFGCFKARPNPTGGFPRSRFTSKGFAQGAEEGVVGGRGQEKDEAAERKRLFCNGYGGCRGGKRSLFSPWMSKMNSVADSLR